MKNTMFMRNIITFLPMLLILFSSMQAVAHSRLTSSVPANGETVAAVSNLSLEFSARLNLMSITLTDAAGKDIALAFTRSAASQSQYDIAINTPLAASTYQVSWMGIGEDGHKVDGNFSFVVTPDTASITGAGAQSSD